MELNINSLCKKYGSNEALKNFTFTFTPGVYGLLGPNGAGKSTLFNILTDNLKRSSGEVTLDGTDILTMGAAYRKIIGFMPQQQGLYPDFTLKRFLYYMASLKGMEKKGIESTIENVCKKVNLYDVMNVRLGAFSGGMKQRALFAQAILDDPGILILDEPTAGLDPKERISIRNLISKIAKDKIVIIATHIVSDIEFISDKILLLKNGVLIKSGTTSDLCTEIYGSVYEVELSKKNDYSAIDNAFVSSYKNSKDVITIRYIDKSKTNTSTIVEPSLEDVYLYYFGKTL